MEGPISFSGYKEQESNLILPEHDDDNELPIFRKSWRLWDMEKIVYSRTGHIWQYGRCALNAGYLRLQTQSQNT